MLPKRVLRSLLVLLSLWMVVGLTTGCKAVSRTMNTSGAADVSADRFIECYEMPRHRDAYWEFVGAVGNHFYMERYETLGATYPEFVGEIRVPIRSMPEGFPIVPQGRPYPAYELPETGAPID